MKLALRDQLYLKPSQYTRAFLESVPVADPEVVSQVSLEGEVPNPMNPPEGCRFHPRCSEAKSICTTQAPDMREIASGHFVTCHL
ncbi:MAG: hypothetical protein JRI85_05530 [Deltaproteobacteria bacterium]|nr:hypothetical protein [Deltaproteobacteria bacterium]